MTRIPTDGIGEQRSGRHSNGQVDAETIPLRLTGQTPTLSA
ncbi:hypothetical protein AB0O34_26020 [Sphaerisporangium sp. NPDC088356]